MARHALVIARISQRRAYIHVTTEDVVPEGRTRYHREDKIRLHAVPRSRRQSKRRR
jgi:hypothetical protein